MVVDLIRCTTMVVAYDRRRFVAVAHRSSGARSPPSTAAAAPARASCTVLGARPGRPHRLDHHAADAAEGRPPRPHARTSRAPTGTPRTTPRSPSAAPSGWTTSTTRAHAWELFRAAPAPLGHDPATIWPDGPAAPDAGVLRLTPWRLRVAGMETLLGRAPVLGTWRAGTSRAAILAPDACHAVGVSLGSLGDSFSVVLRRGRRLLRQRRRDPVVRAAGGALARSGST